MDFYPFKRGSGPLVSVLLPTRGRPAWLAQSMDSLFSLARNKAGLEFLLKVDDDDLPTQEFLDRIKSLLNIKVSVTPRGRGYHDIHLWVNQLAAQATGDWLLLWNDDARMMTQDWDVLMEVLQPRRWSPDDDIFMVTLPTLRRPECNEFIALRRTVFNVLGHFSLSPHGDNWISRVMGSLHLAGKHPYIMVEHFSDRINDATRQESVEAYKTTGPELDSFESISLQVQDMVTLLDFMRRSRHGDQHRIHGSGETGPAHSVSH